jgi:hypothetical protein
LHKGHHAWCWQHVKGAGMPRSLSAADRQMPSLPTASCLPTGRAISLPVAIYRQLQCCRHTISHSVPLNDPTAHTQTHARAHTHTHTLSPPTWLSGCTSSSPTSCPSGEAKVRKVEATKTPPGRSTREISARAACGFGQQWRAAPACTAATAGQGGVDRISQVQVRRRAAGMSGTEATTPARPGTQEPSQHQNKRVWCTAPAQGSAV